MTRFSVNSTNIVMTKSRYFVYTMGHVHDDGINVILKVNDVEKCDSRARYCGEGHYHRQRRDVGDDSGDGGLHQHHQGLEG